LYFWEFKHKDSLTVENIKEALEEYIKHLHNISYSFLS